LFNSKSAIILFILNKAFSISSIDHLALISSISFSNFSFIFSNFSVDNVFFELADETTIETSFPSV
jgi:hypothetical protein